jgi:succinate dehydrogenase / fumarate reductase flavoprotein subunit
MHGANRLGGNSLSDLLVFGRRAGLGAAEYVKGLASAPAVNTTEADSVAADMLGHFERDGKENPYAIQHDLQETMHNLVGIIRTESELKEGIEEVRAQSERAKHTGVEGNRQYNPGWHLAMDLRSMLTVSEAIALAALERKESRGGHTRNDYPDPSPDFGKKTVVVRMGSDGDIQVRQEAIKEMPADLRELLEVKVNG